MTDTPVFEEPRRLLRPQYVKRMSPLMRRPLEWARIFVGSKASAQVTMSRFKNHAVPAGAQRRGNDISVPGNPDDWEYQVGELEPGRWAVWSRYMGGIDDPPEGAEIAWDETGASWVPITSTNGSDGNLGASGGT